MSSIMSGSPLCTTLPATPSPTLISTSPMRSDGNPREAAVRSVWRSRSRIMMDPSVARTARIVVWSTCPSRSWIRGMRAANSTVSFSVPSLKTRSSRRCVRARRSPSIS